MKAVNWFREFGPAVLAAKAERKPILVDFYSETCLGCRQMDAVTYSRSEVQVLLEREFTAVKFNVKEPRAEFRDLLRMAKPLFSPLLLYLDWSGTELRRTTGYLPPAEFVGELGLVLGLADLLHARYAEAYTRFRGAVVGPGPRRRRPGPGRGTPTPAEGLAQWAELGSGTGKPGAPGLVPGARGGVGSRRASARVSRPRGPGYPSQPQDSKTSR
jgi:hypothetical protein